MKRRLIVIGFIAILLVCLPLLAYVSNFGYHWSPTHEVWGQFGDFIGGFLNPLYALLAFLALLYNLRLQADQAEAARDEAREAARSAQDQIDSIRERARREEVQDILRVIAETLDSCYEEVVSTVQSLPQLKLRHVVHEGWRLRSALPKGGAYGEYVRNASTPGTLIEELHGRVKRNAEALSNFVELYETLAPSSPLVAYYRQRYIGLGQLLEDVGSCEPATLAFFKTSDAAAAA